MNFFIILVLCTILVTSDALSDQNAETEEFPVTCDRRQYNFTAVLTDGNGRKCQSNISTIACYGSCDTYEVRKRSVSRGESTQNVCKHDQKVQVTVILADCDEGADDNIRMFTYTEAVTCACQPCDPSATLCLTTNEGKRTPKEKPEPYSMKEWAKLMRLLHI